MRTSTPLTCVLARRRRRRKRMADAARPASVATTAAAPMLMPAMALGGRWWVGCGVAETDVGAEALVMDVGGALSDPSGVRVSCVTDAGSPAESDICGSAFSVIDSVTVISGVTVKVCGDIAFDVGDA